MSTTYTTLEQEYLDYMKEIDQYNEAISLMYWDMRTKAPRKGLEDRADVIATLSQKVHQMSTSDRVKEYITELKGKTESEFIRKAIEKTEEQYNKSAKIPNDEYKEYVKLQAQSESAWEEAKENDDFDAFRPYLEKMVAYNRRFAEYWGYEEHIYDALLDAYEPGVTVAVLDDVFPKVRESLTALLEKIKQSPNQPDPSVLVGHFPKGKQESFSLEILDRMGYDFEGGRLDETVHPFAIDLNQGDVRVTTKYDEKDFRTAVFGTIHEGGHALYEQNIDSKYAYTPLSGGTSMGIHESQSLFWENFVARSKGFWNNHFQLFLDYAPDSFKNVDFDEFYHAVNEVKPSFIRIEADELTYCLHIMVRYELEKALIAGEIEVKDLPKLWDDKMEEYLGIRPSKNSQGVLQDVHWAGGSFGYFPSYALGYMYAAQFHHTMKQDVDVEGVIAEGDFNQIREWLTTNIHQYGSSKKPLEIVHDVTGEGLNPDYLIQYLTSKYQPLYQF
ncbi:peptidase M32 [Pontibacillus halophilus JSM 076056 = DSM 19796]|uniref:Metal-dependent carboxypeptidase n=1 Tax=Pontibacillus halophilus JSM 076056 = DSM 19796 TaxID=1385510 RepID=A0A0A5GL33_9BACI|nr:carboxypeptidase M32 [Pontibacillus halophilus]KGX91923.1 peptidase M32 [Pontibacillus halophilus JSM 076056 = DSM 19796]